MPDLIRFVDERVPADARVALAITPSDVGYPFFGPALDRRLDLLVAGSDDAPGATWAFVNAAWWRAERIGTMTECPKTSGFDGVRTRLGRDRDGRPDTE